MVDELGDAILNQTSLEKAVRAVQELLILVLPALLHANVDLSLAQSASCSTANHLDVIFVATQVVAVKLLEDLHGFII